MVSSISAITFLACISITIAVGIFDFRRFLNSTDRDSEEFSKLASRFKLRFNSTRDINEKMENFRRAKKRISEFGTRQRRAKFGVNKFSLMSDDEQKAFFGVDDSKDDDEVQRTQRSAMDNIVEKTAPTSFDFRAAGMVTPVKDQSKCGSCWAFTVVGAIEAQYLLRYNQTLDLSEQYLINCNTENNACKGGKVLRAINFVKTDGITTEACLRYNASLAQCDANCETQKYYVGGYHSFGKDESQFVQMLYNYGPATISIAVPRELMSYQSGVLDYPGDACKANKVGSHGVVVVGYTEDYWIAKNSWGDDWGENGYFRFKRGQDFCGMTTQMAAPYLNMSIPLPITPPTTTSTAAPRTTTLPFKGCTGGGEFTTMTDELRFQALDWFNLARSQTVKGQYVMKNGELSATGQNMNKLTYNCGLEAATQIYANTCNSSVFKTNEYKMVIKFTYIPSINEAFKKGFPLMYNYTTIQNGTHALDTARFAYSEATSVACAFSSSSCFSETTKFALVCAVTPQQSSKAPLYQLGKPCTQNPDCTKAGVDKCDANLGLCYA